MVRNLVRYVRNSEEPVKTTIIGGFLWYTGIFSLIPTIFVMGYLVRVVRSVGRGSASPPVFERWWELFVDGLKAYVVFGVYLLLPFLNIFLIQDGRGGSTMLLSFLIILTGGGIFAILIPFGIQAGDIVLADAELNAAQTISIGIFEVPAPVVEVPSVYLMLLVVWYVMPAALANFAQKRILLAGFEFDVIRKTIWNWRYAVAWLIYFPLWWLTVFWWLLPWDDQTTLFFSERGQAGIGTELGELIVTTTIFLNFLLLVVAFAVLGAAWTAIHGMDNGQGTTIEQDSKTEETNAP